MLSKTCTYFSDVDKDDDHVDVNQVDYIPSIEKLTKTYNYSIEIVLIRVELWVRSRLKQWINHQSESVNGTNRFEILLCFYEEYQSIALNHYWSEKGPTDPIGYSRFILTALTIIRSMHHKLCNNSRFERLKLHSIDIPNLMKLFEFLILPNREDMIEARDLYNYFHQFSNKSYPDLLTNIHCVNAFGVYCAGQSSAMNESIQEIRVQIEQDKQKKIDEVNKKKQRYMELITIVNTDSCECNVHGQNNRCHRCEIQIEANNIKAEIYEYPLPSSLEGTLAVIFELQMPIEIRCYRDILWQFINRPNPNLKNDMYEWLSDRVPYHNKILRPYYTSSHDYKVKLVSSTKSMKQSHYSTLPIASASVEDFLFENGLKVQISPTKPIKFENECHILTTQLDHPDYKQLQFTIESTQFVQNRVIAQLSDCPLQMNPTQFVEFGSFRSGDRLQWWNLLMIFEMDSLPIAEESVAILIIHSMLQYGPLTVDIDDLSHHWCSNSHEQLMQDHFVDELISRLDHHLGECKLNWQNELVLLVITMITMRVFTICNSTKINKVVDLALKCRQIGIQWIDLISKNIQTISSSVFDEIENLRRKMINVGISCLLTFSTHHSRIKHLLSSNKHIISLLKAATTVHDNIILSNNQSKMSIFMRNMMRFSEHVLVMIQPTVARVLKQTSYQSLNEFAAIYWSVIKSEHTMKEQWKKRKTNIYDGWYDCCYESKCISIDCIKGNFLVNGTGIGFLHEKITSNELFVRVFGNQIFEVQAVDLSNTYITKYLYHGTGRVRYEFHFNDEAECLTITERHIQTKKVFQLIPHNCFETELPDAFVSNYSHWWNAKDQKIEFRSVHFKDPEFLNNKPYVLSLKTGYLMTTKVEDTQTLVNQSSTFFRTLFNWYFIRLDDAPYVYMMKENSSWKDDIIYIHLSRLGIAFQYNTRNKIITSREYSNMYIDQNQWLGTLTGLKSGLVLSPLSVKIQRLAHYPYRKLIVPFGEIHSTETLYTDHQTITIQRPPSIPFSHQYFVFMMNDRLKILQSTDSPTGWLYLALLHAMTSHHFPDQYTQMTGMERAFQLLNLAGCWSDQPFDALSLNILAQIAAISPRVNYYPENLTCMVKIDWNSNGIPYSMQHFGYYLIAKKLIDTSQQMYFMYPSSICNRIPKIFMGTSYNERLLTKLYWDYRDSYNPLTRLSAEMNTDILCANSVSLYRPIWKHCSHAINDSTVCLVNDLYANGNVNLIDCSQQHWLPLSQWLGNDHQLKNIWIGLLKLADCITTSTNGNNKDERERFEKLIDFLHYIFDKHGDNSFYLEMLKTALKMPTTMSTFTTYPSFIKYIDIEETSFIKERIKLPRKYELNERNQILAQIENCFSNGSNYENNSIKRKKSTKVVEINQLLTSWQNNRKLRSFLEFTQNQFCSITTEQFPTKLSYSPQQFTIESIEGHHQIQVKPTDILIDEELLQIADEIFHRSYSHHFKKQLVTCPTVNRQNKFPQEIFSSINDQDNSFSNISNYFKNQLAESWSKLLLNEKTEIENPVIEEIIELHNSFQQKSQKLWKELVESIMIPNEQLFKTGLISRIIPTTLISYFQQKLTTLDVTTAQPTLLGGILVYWTLEQQLERALHFAIHNKWEDFTKEISNIPHSNWIPSEHVSWLILELEMNITIRAIQINVARHMMEPKMTTEDDTKMKTIVMQMNMGEGKTSVILPMLALSLCSSSSCLVRIIVLKSLFSMNYQSLRSKLGGLLNRRIFPFLCRRDIKFTERRLDQISIRLAQAIRNCDIILTSPEDILSFELLTIDKCRRYEFRIARSMLTLQRLLKNYVRDVLDESDEILHVKYQLIYTVGDQQQVDGGAERWLMIQSILDLVKKYAADISINFPKEVCYQLSKRKSSFPQFRLHSDKPFSLLTENIANDWINNRNYRHADKQIILSFILERNSSVDDLVKKFPFHDIQLFLIIRGLFSSEVLLVALKQRYRVNYGINTDPCFNRLMSVPFRAKDVVTDRTEFGHPDVALVITQLSYYYSGLNDQQLIQCFNRLNNEETDPISIYHQWLSYDGDDNIPTSIRQWKGVNLKDYQQRIQDLFPTFRYNMLVINYFLNYFVYPREAKQFRHKLISSPWDLSSPDRSKIITGFSGTNDTQLLLPVHIRQYDLPELQKTDAIVVNNLLQPENEHYQSLSMNASSNEILHQIINYKDMINVILDVGALFIDGTNQDIAIQWLNLSDKDTVDYVVYFNSDSIFVCNRQYHHHRFETSPASERLDHCIFYIDEIHTRGTDFKFPYKFKAAVTLGNGLTKDRFVQACMRMRKLGNGHSLIFWSSYEVHQQIITSKTYSFDQNQGKENVPHLIDILRWVYSNTIQSTWEGLKHWAIQSLSFQRKLNAFWIINWENQQQLFSDIMMKDLARECLEWETIELIQMYGTSKVLQTIEKIYLARYQQCKHHLSTEIHNAVLKRLQVYGGSKQCQSQLLDVEQQRELEQEFEQEFEEERQLARPAHATPCEPKLHDKIKKLCDMDGTMLNLAQFPDVFQHLPEAFKNTTFANDCQPDAWQRNFWISTEFQQVVQTQGESLDLFLRPPRWIVVYRNQHIIFVSVFEANWLISHLQSSISSITTLRLLLPRSKRGQSIFANTPTLTIPPSIASSENTAMYVIPIKQLVQLFIFNGTLYFETVAEQTAYCQCLRLCPKPRTIAEEKAFEKNWIAVDGFVENPKYRRRLEIYQARIDCNPLVFVRRLIENRNSTYLSIMSHIGSIVLNSFKLM
ncbi:unnamed protein product [Rotaria sordida]|uniref:ubiquitinyl hydrolase 1 n=1 Tax=Rotaria sordida TaxID=392033 RepID=A0A815ZRU2_9BILA|nr:unnamed protein product [Rotaria sordida]CAF1586364.1 unnamed protein product [Rotaria sordida]